MAIHNRKIVCREEQKFSFYCFFSPGPHGQIKAEFMLNGKPVFALGDTHEEAAHNILLQLPKNLSRKWLGN